MGQRYILALVLMIIVMFAWSLLFGNRLSKQRTAQKEAQTSEQSRETQSPYDDGNTADADEQRGTGEVERNTRIQQTTEARVLTDRYKITFAVESAIAKKWSLKEYHDRSDSGEYLNLIPPDISQLVGGAILPPSIADRFNAYSVEDR